MKSQKSSLMSKEKAIRVSKLNPDLSKGVVPPNLRAPSAGNDLPWASAIRLRSQSVQKIVTAYDSLAISVGLQL